MIKAVERNIKYEWVLSRSGTAYRLSGGSIVETANIGISGIDYASNVFGSYLILSGNVVYTSNNLENFSSYEYKNLDYEYLWSLGYTLFTGKNNYIQIEEDYKIPIGCEIKKYNSGKEETIFKRNGYYKKMGDVIEYNVIYLSRPAPEYNVSITQTSGNENYNTIIFTISSCTVRIENNIYEIKDIKNEKYMCNMSNIGIEKIGEDVYSSVNGTTSIHPYYIIESSPCYIYYEGWSSIHIIPKSINKKLSSDSTEVVETTSVYIETNYSSVIGIYYVSFILFMTISRKIINGDIINGREFIYYYGLPPDYQIEGYPSIQLQGYPIAWINGDDGTKYIVCDYKSCYQFIDSVTLSEIPIENDRIAGVIWK